MRKQMRKLLCAGALISGLANCVAQYNSKQKEPEQPDCSSMDLTEKVGFSTKVNPGSEHEGCYKINSGGGQYFEYFALCSPPVPGNRECYRSLAGPDKGQIELQYVSDFMGLLGYTSFIKTLSGEIKSPDGAEIPSDAEQGFKLCEELLNWALQVPKVCSELQEYKMTDEKK